MALLRYPLEAFVADAKHLMASSNDVADILNRGSTLQERLIATPDWLPEAVRRPRGSGANPNHGSYLLYCETPGGEGLTVTAVLWGPGDHAGPHDHHTWGLIGLVQNTIQETRFRRLDDGQRPEYALLEQDRVDTFQPGQVSVLTPGSDEIHQMDNPATGSRWRSTSTGETWRGWSAASSTPPLGR